jgi:tetratricopeptide (TPR) repeat protein
MMTIDHRLRFNQGVLENLLQISQQYFDEGKPEEALRPLDTYVQFRPDNAEALALRAKSLESLGRHREAAEAYAEAIRFDPSVEAYLQRARSLRAAQAPAEALACLDVARVQWGELPALEAEAMDCERELKHFDAALEHNLRLLKSPGPNEELLEIRGDLYAEAGMNDEALAAWQQALKTLEAAAGEAAASPHGLISRLKEKIDALGYQMGA